MKVYIEASDGLVQRMFEEHGWSTVYDPQQADLICFTGGADVSPMLYRCHKHPATRSVASRDENCTNLAVFAEEQSIPMVGICRGGQFLNVFCGGTMWQHVEGHAMQAPHEAIDIRTGERLQVTSTHHQMMCPSDDAEVVLIGATTNTRREYDSPENINILPECPDMEVVYYHEFKVLCFQPHPEYVPKNHECREYFFRLLQEYLLGEPEKAVEGV